MSNKVIFLANNSANNDYSPSSDALSSMLCRIFKEPDSDKRMHVPGDRKKKKENLELPFEQSQVIKKHTKKFFFLSSLTLIGSKDWNQVWECIRNAKQLKVKKKSKNVQMHFKINVKTNERPIRLN